MSEVDFCVPCLGDGDGDVESDDDIDGDCDTVGCFKFVTVEVVVGIVATAGSVAVVVVIADADAVDATEVDVIRGGSGLVASAKKSDDIGSEDCATNASCHSHSYFSMRYVQPVPVKSTNSELYLSGRPFTRLKSR